jgi:hypothetical protein
MDVEFGLEYLVYISWIRNNQKYSNDNVQTTRINEEISRNKQSLNEQNVNNVQFKMSSDCSTNEAQRELEVKSARRPMGLSGLSPLRSDCSHDSQVGRGGGRLDCISSGQRQLKGPIRLESTQIKWFSCNGQAGRLDHVSSGQKTPKVS